MHPPPIFPDPFAVEWGHDKFGTFQSFAVENVVQRMRWIPPGTFMMGSPENEVGRYEDEFQHKVQIANGFWLGDTPVTQALWEAVVGENPSFFNGPDNPVEKVSWHECQNFIARLNERINGLEARLPTEEEWEYACRAGTKTATWIDQPGHEHRQIETVGWFVANSGKTTHAVALKLANPWGLYDIFGNVWEWCADWYSQYDVTAMQDPIGQTKGSRRVLRGGSWDSMAELIRSANRYAYRPSRRFANFGLRLARSATRVP